MEKEDKDYLAELHTKIDDFLSSDDNNFNDDSILDETLNKNSPDSNISLEEKFLEKDVELSLKNLKNRISGKEGQLLDQVSEDDIELSLKTLKNRISGKED